MMFIEEPDGTRDLHHTYPTNLLSNAANPVFTIPVKVSKSASATTPFICYHHEEVKCISIIQVVLFSPCCNSIS
jgi:hypothetical protein